MADSSVVSPALARQTDFTFRAVDGSRPFEVAARAAAALAGHPLPNDAPADLGPLVLFTGNFRGIGFNTIFRPDSSATPTKFNNPIGPGNPRDNVLELNLTEEVLSFSANLGQVPNRGSGGQADITLNAVPYLQSITDVTFPKRAGIHFEPGLWLHVPATTSPSVPVSLARTASIPHGTTINAQGGVIATTVTPTIDPVDITPFAGGSPTSRISFQSQKATLTNTPRIPQDLTSFLAAGTITQAMIDDPNSVLRAHIAHQTITRTIVIGISTNPSSLLPNGPLASAGKPAPVLSPKFGGGPADIAFLDGVAKPDPTKAQANAQAAQMDAVFWIETVIYDVDVPEIPSGLPAVPCRIVGPAAASPITPSFVAAIPFVEGKKFAGGIVKVETTQIQYSQKVILNFATLGWPHVSVATLVPADPIHIPLSLLPLS